MAYVFSSGVTETVITIAAKTADGRSVHETHVFNRDRDGQELTNQITDTVLSALHLAGTARAAVTVAEVQK